MAQETIGQAVGETQEKAPQLQVPKKKAKWPKRAIAGVATVAILAAVVTLSGGGSQAVVSTYVPAQAERQALAITVTGSAIIQPNDSYRATALVKGEVLSAPFEEGDTVKKDDILFAVDAKDVETAIKQAQLALEQAQLNYNSLLRTQQETAEDRQVKATANGVITKVYVDPGDDLTAGTPIAELLDRDNMKLKVPFHSVNAQQFYLGQGATVAVSGTGETLIGTVSEIAATDTVGVGGTLVREVTITVKNPGVLTDASIGSAAVNGATCAATGSFSYAESEQIVAKYTGELQSLTVKEGDRVYDGQVLGQFKENASLQDQIDAAAISVSNAQLSLQRSQDSLDDYNITSPIDGIVIEKNYKVGDNVDPTTLSSAAMTSGGALAVVYDMSNLTFDLSVSERDVVLLKVGQKVTFTADALDNQSFTGVVTKVNINGTTTGGNTSYPVTVTVDGDGLALAEQGLLPGMNVSATVMVEEIGSVLAVPVDAVQRGNVVLVPGKGALNDKGELVDAGKLEERQVTLGRNNDDYIEILSGLEEGETVYVPNSSSNIMSAMMAARGG